MLRRMVVNCLFAMVWAITINSFGVITVSTKNLESRWEVVSNYPPNHTIAFADMPSVFCTVVVNMVNL